MVRKTGKKEVVQKGFGSTYSAEKTILRMNYKKNLIDSTVNSSIIKMSQSENNKLDN